MWHTSPEESIRIDKTVNRKDRILKKYPFRKYCLAIKMDCVDYHYHLCFTLAGIIYVNKGLKAYIPKKV